MLTIFRGDDPAFAEYDRKVCVRFDTFNDLTGWSAKFSLLDTVKETDDISSRIWTFGYSAEETEAFPFGRTFGKLLVIDSKGNLRQMARVEVEIVNKKCEPCIAGFIAISVDNIISDYSLIGNKPSINGKTVEGEQDGAYYGLASQQEIDALDARVRALEDDSDSESDPSHEAEIEELRRQLAEETTLRMEGDIALGARIGQVETNIEQEIVSRQNGDISLDQKISDLRTETTETMDMLVDGKFLVSSLLFESEDDDENYYKVRIVLRDTGSGERLPAFALVAVPKGDESSVDVDVGGEETGG